MPWPIPTAKAIAERIASTIETAVQAVRPDIDPVALSRAVRSARGMFAILGRAVAPALRQVHDHIGWWSRQYFADTAEEEFAYRHADMWGVEHRAATFSTGAVLVEGVVGTAVPAALELAGSDGLLFAIDAPAAIGPGGTVIMTVTAVSAGPASNLEPGIRLRTVAPFPSISRITVQAPGLAGGAPEETPRELSAKTVERIRQPPHGGAGFDYPVWLREAYDVRAVRVVTDWIGRGSVGVIVAMRDGDFGRTPTPTELDDMLNHLGPPGSSTGLRPVTAHVVLVPAEIIPMPISVRLRPDTAETRAAVAEAFARYVATIGDAEDEQNDGPIGALIEPSRISDALSAAAGEYAHDLPVPAAPYRLAAAQYPTPGVITWLPPL